MLGKPSDFNKFNTQGVQLDIANWVSRQPYELLANIETKVKKRLQRKYKLKIGSKTLNEKVKHYREIYYEAKKILPEYTLPSKSGFSEPRYIKSKDIEEFLSKRFAVRDKEILVAIINWVVEYEYLR